jgi:purine nucleosidase
MTIRIVIDADPGQDDAVALLLALASDEVELAAVTTVAGNVPVAQTAANARRVLDLAGSAVPVHQGAAAPLLLPLETAEFVCGPDGLAGADLPPPSRGPDPLPAAEALVRLARAPGPPLTICALGPLTNLALALRLAPDIAPRLARIVLMGGARDLGNMTPAAEFNVYVDPHAAAIVLGAGVPVVMFGLHVTHQAVPGPDDVARIAALGTATGRAVAGMLTRPRPGGLGTSAHPMHDPCVVAWLLWPELFTGRDCWVEVETAPGTLRGRTTIDWNNRLRRAPNAHVPGTIDAPGFWAGLIDRLARLP